MGEGADVVSTNVAVVGVLAEPLVVDVGRGAAVVLEVWTAELELEVSALLEVDVEDCVVLVIEPEDVVGEGVGVGVAILEEVEAGVSLELSVLSSIPVLVLELVFGLELEVEP